MKLLKRRRLGRLKTSLALLLTLGLLAAACGGSSENADSSESSSDRSDSNEGESSSGDRVEIRWFVGLGTGSQEEQIDGQEKIIEEFNDSQDQIELVVEFVDNGTASSVLATQIAAGNAPDIIGPVGLGGSNAFAGQYLDLSGLIESTGYDIERFDETSEIYRDDDGLTGIPFAVFPSAMYYNKDLFDEAGLPYPPAAYGDGGITTYGEGTEWEGEWNYDKVEEISKILSVDVNGNDANSPEYDKTAIEQFGYVNQFTEDPAAMGSHFGAGSVVSPDDTAKIPDQWVAQWKWYQNMIHNLGAAPSFEYQESEVMAGNAFNSGRVAMANTHLWYTCCLADEDGNFRDNWDLAALPNYEGTVVSKFHGDTFRIHEESEHPEEAFEVLVYLQDTAGLELLSIYGAMPADSGGAGNFFVELDQQFTQDVNWDVIIDGLDYPDVPNHEANMPNFLEADARIKELKDPILSDPDFDIDAAVKELESDLDEIWSEG